MKAVRKLLAVPAVFGAICAAAHAADDKTETQNKQRDKQEFGAHERPWAQEYSMDPDTTVPGIAESKTRIEEALQNPEGASAKTINARLVNTQAALEAIREERLRLDEERRALADARALAEAAGRRVQEEMAQLKVLRDDVAALIDELERKEDENIARVVELVSNLSAKNAARILAENDPRFVVQVLDALDSRITADILGRMETDRAQEIIGYIASRGRPGEDDPAIQGL